MSNYFQLYHDLVQEYEAPQNYHAWSSIGAISALLGKKCTIPYGTFNVFPNLYIILVGDPGLKKSSAMNIAKKLVRSIEGVKTASDSGSREGLMDEMSKNKVTPPQGNPYWQSAIFVDEVGDLLGGEHLDAGMVRFLTTIWDLAIYREATRKSGQVVIHNPYLTLLGCCPIEWLTTKLRMDVITGGLSRRTIYVYETKLHRLNSRPPTPNPEVESLLRLEAQRIFDLSGEFRMSKPAWDLFDRVYLDIQENLLSYPKDLQYYFSSKHMLVLKLCMCLSAGVDSRKRISAQMVRFACTFLEETEKRLNVVFSGVGRNELKGFSDRIVEKIKAAGNRGLTRAEVLAAFYNNLSKAEINEIIDYLVETAQIKQSLPTSTQDLGRFSAPLGPEAPQAVNLLKLVRQLQSCDEEIEEAKIASDPARHLDPATERLLAHQKDRQQQTRSGVLLKGTLALISDESQSPSTKLGG